MGLAYSCLHSAQRAELLYGVVGCRASGRTDGTALLAGAEEASSCWAPRVLRHEPFHAQVSRWPRPPSPFEAFCDGIVSDDKAGEGSWTRHEAVDCICNEKT